MFVWVLDMPLSRPVVKLQGVFEAKVFLSFQDKKTFSQEHQTDCFYGIKSSQQAVVNKYLNKKME